MPVSFVIPVLLLFVFYYVVGKFVSAYVLRLTTNETLFESSEGQSIGKLGCDWSLARMLGIYLGNIVAIIFSLGLLIPWAQMRILRYQLDQTWVETNSDLNSVVADQTDAVSSVGEEIGEVFDVDIGL